MKIKFKNTAILFLNARLNAGLLQKKVSVDMGYKNSQYISNIERGVCSIPFKKISITAKILNISPDSIIRAILADYDVNIRKAIRSCDENN